MLVAIPMVMAAQKSQSPREKRSQRTRKAILNAARDIINSQGAQALSVRKIAREIDYSPAALYEYFKSKDDIMEALCRQVDTRLASYLNHQNMAADLSPADRLIELGINYLRFAKENEREYGILFTRAPPGPEETPDYGSAFLILVDAVSALLADPTHDTETILNKDAFAYSCWAFVHGMATLNVQVAAKTTQDLDAINRAALTRFIYGNSPRHYLQEQSQEQSQEQFLQESSK